MKRLAKRLGYDLVKADYYSPVPDLAGLPASTWSDPAPMPGVDLRIPESADFLDAALAPHVAEYLATGSPHGYDRGNSMYPMVDGEILYAMLRHLEPRRVVEVGAGWSTRVIRDALAGRDVTHRSFDPHPTSPIADVEPLRAQDIPAAVFAELEAGDVLFVDTTHTVKVGGDVLRLVLEVMPALAPGVVIHIHDFYRPFEYPRQLVEHYGVVWQEQYLVQGFLAFNTEFEVLIANHALGGLEPERLAAVVPGIPPGISPGSALWLRRRPA